MSKGNDSRVNAGRDTKGGARSGPHGVANDARTSRSSIVMTAERARAIQARSPGAGTPDDDDEVAPAAERRSDEQA